MPAKQNNRLIAVIPLTVLALLVIADTLGITPRQDVFLSCELNFDQLKVNISLQLTTPVIWLWQMLTTLL